MTEVRDGEGGATSHEPRATSLVPPDRCLEVGDARMRELGSAKVEDCLFGSELYAWKSRALTELTPHSQIDCRDHGRSRVSGGTGSC